MIFLASARQGPHVEREQLCADDPGEGKAGFEIDGRQADVGPRVDNRRGRKADRESVLFGDQNLLGDADVRGRNPNAEWNAQQRVGDLDRPFDAGHLGQSGRRDPRRPGDVRHSVVVTQSGQHGAAL